MINKHIPRKEELLDSNFNNEFRGRTTVVRPICNEQITDKYFSWLNDESLNQYLEVRHQKQNLRTVTNYINSLRKKPNCDMFAIFTKKDR